MQKLIQGIHHFQNTLFGSQRRFFEHLAKGQSPEALFITCSDSRINPNLLTQTEPGELFILRNAGNLVPRYDEYLGGEAATIEFAVAGLGIKDIIICGHSHCGAMNALLEPASIVRLPALKHWLKHADVTRQVMEEKYTDRQGEALLKATIQENVLTQMENLHTHPVVASGIAAGTLKLHGWVYKIETGEVFAYEPELGQFQLLTAFQKEIYHADSQLIPTEI
jgi:carbonic anhydrase